MDQAHLQKINREVYRRYPEFEGQKPRVQKQPAKRNSDPGQAIYVLVYRTRLETSDKKWMSRYVRVTATEDGKILKMSTSR